MDGLEAVEIKFTEVVKDNYSFRFDSSYFQKEFLYEDLAHIQHEIVADLCDIKSGTTPIDRDNELKEGIVLLKTNNIRDNLLLSNASQDFFYIDEPTNERMQATQLLSNDVLINIVGATTGVIGRVAYVTAEFPKANITQAMAFLRVKPNKNLEPLFLFTFLLSKFGDKQVRRIARPTGQYNLNLVELSFFKVPILSESFQSVVSQIVKKSYLELEKGQNRYLSAENVLLEHLGLKDWQPSEAGVSVKSFADAFGSERLDPEFYQPKFDELENIIAAKENVRPLGEFLMVNARGKQPNYEDDGVLVVNSKHVRTGKVIVTDNRRATLEKGALTIRKGDVLINGTGVGTIGRCAPYLHDETALPDNHVIVLRTNDLDPVYLSVYLNSPAGQLQVDKHFKGSSGQIELYPDQIANFYVWKAPEGIQKQIREKVEASYEVEQLSEQLLDLAKRGVELAIEESEGAALAWIEERMSDLGLGDDASR